MTVEHTERLTAVVYDAFGGWHHIIGKVKDLGVFKGHRGVSFGWHGDLSTYDFDRLTRLVVSCHANRVRAEIKQGGPGAVKVILCERDAEGDMTRAHPGLDELIARCNVAKAESLHDAR